jgi:MFS transporter, DHA3 family, macrolide efflux protein
MIVILVMVVNLLFTPMFTLLPVLVTQRFEGGVCDLAVIQAAWAIGIALGGLTLGVWGGFKRRILTSMAALALIRRHLTGDRPGRIDDESSHAD